MEDNLQLPAGHGRPQEVTAYYRIHSPVRSDTLPWCIFTGGSTRLQEMAVQLT